MPDAGGHHRLARGHQPGGGRGAEQLVAGPIQRLGRGPTGDMLGTRVPKREAVVETGDHDGIVRLVEQLGLLADAQLGLFALADVGEDVQAGGGLAGGVADERDAHRQIEGLAVLAVQPDVALPSAGPEDGLAHRVDLRQRQGARDLLRSFAEGLGLGPAGETGGALIPKGDPVVQAGDDDGVVGLVEIVGQLADAQFGLLAFGDIAAVGDKVRDPAAGVGDGRDGFILYEELPVFPAVVEFGAEDPALEQGFPEGGVKLRAMPVRLEQARGLPHRLGQRVARGPFEGGIDVLDDARGIGDDDVIGGLLDHLRNQAQLGFRLTAVGDVENHRQENSAIRRTSQLQVHFDRVKGAIGPAMDGLENQQPLFPAEERAEQGPKRHRIEIRLQVHRCQRAQLIQRVTQIALRALVYVFKAQVLGIEQVNFIQTLFDYFAQPVVLGFAVLARGDVAGEAEGGGDGTGVVAQGHGVRLQGAPGALETGDVKHQLAGFAAEDILMQRTESTAVFLRD